MRQARGGGLLLAIAAVLLAAALSQPTAPTVRNFPSKYRDGVKPGIPPSLPNDAPDDLVVEMVWWFAEGDEVVQIKFVPNTTQVITVHKRGFMRLYQSINALVTDYTTLFDMNLDVYSNSDHGMLSVEFHPDWPTKQQLFLLYTGEPKSVKSLPNYATTKTHRVAGWGPDMYRWGDICPCLNCGDKTGLLDNMSSLICEHPYYIDRIDVNLATVTVANQMTLMQTACGSSSTHGPGTLTTVGKNLIFSQGDGSQYLVPDYGYPTDDGCYDPLATAPGFQGSFRAQRDDMSQGKVLMIPYAMLNSAVTIDVKTLTTVVKGVRNSFRTFYHSKTDTLYLGDVGYGDGDTTERIFSHTGIATPSKYVSNFGWPCLEGIRGTPLGPYKLWDSASEQARMTYVQGATPKLTGCDGVYAAAEQYVKAQDPTYVISHSAGLVADANWKPPLYEYRKEALDPNNPDVCSSTYAAITSVFIYDGVQMPDVLQGKLFFSDYVRKCLFYFDADANGKPITTSPPHVLLVDAALVHMQTGPDGYIYGVDYAYNRLIRMYQFNEGPYYGTTTYAPTAPPTIDMQDENFVDPGYVTTAERGFDANAIPELEWTTELDGSYSGTLTLNATEIVTPERTIRTRAFNNMVPGPTLRFKPCGTYHLKLVNALDIWPNPTALEENTMGSPVTTNLHLHGLHISGETPGDDSFTEILPGESFDYTFRIPCDHVGGTNLYHPHHHGSVALQTNGGAVGMILVDPSAREALDMPLAYQALPEHLVVFQEFTPALQASMALDAGDKLWTSSIIDDFSLTNGNEEAEGGTKITVEAGQWTKIRLLRVGVEFNGYMTLETTTHGATNCDLVLLAKDGVPLASLPRELPLRTMFLSMASRVDVAIRCPLAAVPHHIIHKQIGNSAVSVEFYNLVASITVVASTRAAAAALAPYTPCRPAYLQDLADIPTDSPVINVEMRDGIDGHMYGYKWDGVDTYFISSDVGKVMLWNIAGDDVHPLHVHVNHMQLGPMSDLNQRALVPGWNIEGDWIDTISIPDIKAVYIRPTEFSGKMVLHCHIAEHSDLGFMAVVNLTGVGVDGTVMPTLSDFGTCQGVVPDSTPYGGVVRALGVIEAENFDLGYEAIGYHNENYATATANSIRVTEAVEIGTSAGVTYVSNTRQGEWLRYSVNVAAAGYYTVTMTATLGTNEPGPEWSMWLDLSVCASPLQTDYRLAQSTIAAPVVRTDVAGTDFDTWTVTTRAPFTTPGDHTILLCFDGTSESLLIDNFSFTRCGSTIAECPGATVTEGQLPVEIPPTGVPEPQDQSGSDAPTPSPTAASTSTPVAANTSGAAAQLSVAMSMLISMVILPLALLLA